MLHAHLLSACKYNGDHSATCRLDPPYCHSGHLSPVNNLSVLNWIPARRRYLPLPTPEPPSAPPLPRLVHRFSINYLFTQLESVHFERVCWTIESEHGGGRRVLGRRALKLQREKIKEQVVCSGCSQPAVARTEAGGGAKRRRGGSEPQSA